MKKWWEKPMRVLQFNLQEKDASLMNCAKIAADVEKMGANTLCMNAGGIVAWYPSKVSGHNVNPYMNGRDILGEIIDECHKRNIKVLARFDSSAIEDHIYLQHPNWVCRRPDGSAITQGEMRMGSWELLYLTCAFGGYQNSGVIEQVLEEAMSNYDIDGVFWNNSYAKPCWCNVCKEEYFKLYHKEMPNQADDFEPDWLSYCSTATAMKYWRFMHTKHPDKPFIRYYFPASMDCDQGDNVEERILTGNMLCTEAQNILSRGRYNLPNTITPATRMKFGRTIDDIPAPFGIIHTCPGMDWRHTGMSTKEYLFWCSQVLANGGQFWSSITGFTETNEDQRILGAVAEINHRARLVEEMMEDAVENTQVLLLCDNGPSVTGWAEGLTWGHITYSLLSSYQVSTEKLQQFDVVVLPEGYVILEEQADMFEAYVKAGGNLLVESAFGQDVQPIYPLLGIADRVVTSENLCANYIRLSDDYPVFLENMDGTHLLPLSGHVGYCTAKSTSQVVTTLVPTFAPLDSVGAPPERASLPASHTNVPMSILSKHGDGSVLYLPIQLGRLIREFGMEDHYTFLKNSISLLAAKPSRIDVNAPGAIQMTLFEKDSYSMVHFVNSIGARPLTDIISCYGISFTLSIPIGKIVKSVESVIEKHATEYSILNDTVTVTCEKLNIWDMIKVNYQE